MTCAIEKTGLNLIKLSVELNKDDLARYVREAEQVLSNDLEVPGFRKGKAPKETIRKQVGEAKILETAMEGAMQRSLAQAISEQGLDVLEVSNLVVKENSTDKLLYTVTVKVFPEVKIPDLSSIKVAGRAVAVEPKEVDNALEMIKASRASLSDTNDPAGQGDKVEIDFEIRDNGAIIDGGVSKNHPVRIGGSNFIPGFEEELVGMKKGNSKKFSLKVPADFSNKAIAGKKLDFDVTVQDIKKVNLPALTDEFARGLGKFDNVDQLILSVKEGLLAEKKEKEHQRLRLEIMNKIIAGMTGAIPEAMIEEQLDNMIQDFDRDLHRHDMELSIYLSKLGKTPDNLRKDWRNEAERQVKMALALHVVAKDRQIEVKPEELNEALNVLAQSILTQNGGSPADLDIEQMRSSVQSKLLSEKTLDFIERTCTA